MTSPSYLAWVLALYLPAMASVVASTAPMAHVSAKAKNKQRPQPDRSGLVKNSARLKRSYLDNRIDTMLPLPLHTENLGLENLIGPYAHHRKGDSGHNGHDSSSGRGRGSSGSGSRRIFGNIFTNEIEHGLGFPDPGPFPEKEPVEGRSSVPDHKPLDLSMLLGSELLRPEIPESVQEESDKIMNEFDTYLELKLSGALDKCLSEASRS